MSRLEKPEEVAKTLQRQRQMSIAEQHDIELHDQIDGLLDVKISQEQEIQRLTAEVEQCIEHCKGLDSDIDELEQENEKLKAQMQEANDILEFYNDGGYDPLRIRYYIEALEQSDD